MRINVRVKPLIILTALSLTVYHVYNKWKNRPEPQPELSPQAKAAEFGITSSKTFKAQSS
jgi:hypothetical protein